MEETNNIYKPLKEEWHLSKYNLFAKIPDKDQVGCVNLLRGSCSIITSEEFSKLQNGEITQHFINQGYIINYNETEAIETISRNVCNSSELLSVTICPTMNCNFNCSYCFEKHRTGKISKELQNVIINFIKRTIFITKVRRIKITWFGGEPLLAMDVIESLSKELIELCNKWKINYNADIVTNGYLLTQEIADKFFEFKINDCQITLDGIGDGHNKTRHLINNNPTFDKIINNLKNIKFKCQINIRHNVYADNTNEIEPLKKLVEKIAKESGNKLYYYPAFTNDVDSAVGRKKELNYLNMEDFYCYEIDKKIQSFAPYKGTYCGAQLLTFIVIDELGNLYKCWEDLGRIENSFGRVENWNVNDPIPTASNPQIIIDYINSGGATKDKECLDCVWLPLCQGGCPHRRLFYDKACISCKNKSEEFVLKYIDFHQKQAERMRKK